MKKTGKIENQMLGLFPHVEQQSMEANLFDLLSLYNTLIERSLSLLPGERQQEFSDAHKLINDQRKLYKRVAAQK